MQARAMHVYFLICFDKKYQEANIVLMICGDATNG